MIPPAKVMSELVEPFVVRGRLTGEEYKVHFSHLWVGMTTRHADAIDCKFLVNGRSVVVGLAHLGFVDFKQRAGCSLTDQEVAAIAAAFLREFLASEHELPTQPLPVTREELLGLAGQLGLLTASDTGDGLK